MENRPDVMEGDNITEFLSELEILKLKSWSLSVRSPVKNLDIWIRF